MQTARLLSLIAAGLFAAKFVRAAAPALTNDDLEVIRFHFAPTDPASSGRLVVLQDKSTIGYSDPSGDWRQRLREQANRQPASIREAIEDFISKNAESVKFHGLEIPGLRVVVVPRAKLTSIFSPRGGDWFAFYNEYPGADGFHSLSRIGTSKDRTIAIYSCHVQRGPTDGWGRLLVLRKDGARWVDAKLNIGWSVISSVQAPNHSPQPKFAAVTSHAGACLAPAAHSVD